MYKVLPEDRSERLGEELQWYWDKEVEQAKKDLRVPKLTKAIVKCYWKSYAVLGAFTLIEETLKVIQPVFLGKLIIFFETYNPDNREALYVAYGYAAGVSLSTFALAILHHLYFYHVQRSGMKIRVAMCHMIFKKALCLSNTSLGKTTTGQIVNLLSNDVNKFDEVTIFLHFLWIGPLQAAAVTALLWQEIGPSCLAGMAILVFLMPLQTFFGRLFSKLRKEISKVKKSSYLRGMNMASFFVANKIILFITFTTFVLLGNPISASKVFVTVSLYSAVSLTVTLFFPSAIERASETMISIRRIKNFLILDEIVKPSVELHKEEKKDVLIHMKDAICYWDKNLDAPTLQNVSFTVHPGQLLAVIGPVGAGKDVDILPDGDMTVIGDRGATLSGGQKARVNLARAVYQDTDIYLLDDPLSAVDAEVGRHLFEKCICGVLRNKPRILVTHQLQYLQAADQILVLKEGHMVAKGTYGELQRSGVDFTSLLKQDEDDEQAPTEQNGSRASKQKKLNVTQGAHNHNETQQLDLGFYLGVYAGLTVVTVIFGFLRSLLFFKVLVNSAQTLHNQMFQSILRTPVRFFDINPIGRILNRFSKDIGQLDNLLALTFADFVQLGVLSSPTCLRLSKGCGPFVPLKQNKDFKENLMSIKISIQDFLFLPPESWFLFLTTSRWFAVRLDGLCAIFVTTIAFGSLLLANELEAGDVGLALSYAVTLIGMFQWGVRQSAEVENQMTSVERVLDYTELESEAPWVTECRPPPDWPRHGVIVFEGVNFAYSHDGPHVLKNMHAVFRSKEKVGVVGRTGAGKSSLISALFRLAEPDGSIRIDGVLTSELGLHDLRMKMSIIPQVEYPADAKKQCGDVVRAGLPVLDNWNPERKGYLHFTNIAQCHKSG
ncbi:UNVERIFIED_CONTAM: hypothetical protein FKN15_064827 [Acipenser sinensis]